MPDLFQGDPLPLNRPPGFSVPDWLKGPPGHGPDKVEPVIEETIKAMKGEMGVKRIGAVGYCFGAKYVVRFMAEGKGVDVGYCAHPSYVEAEELKAIKGPLCISAAGAFESNLDPSVVMQSLLPNHGVPFSPSILDSTPISPSPSRKSKTPLIQSFLIAQTPADFPT